MTDSDALNRIAAALEQKYPPPKVKLDRDANAFLWHADPDRLEGMQLKPQITLDLLKGIDRSRDTLYANTERFAFGLPANNALLWGARGTGKSSLVKAVVLALNQEYKNLKIIEIQREDVPSLDRLLRVLVEEDDSRFVLFCDDLSFSHDDAHYKTLKAVLDGGLFGRPKNVILYATSNRRHLMPREMADNERAAAIHENEAAEEQVSLSDRFGLWLGFHPCTQDEYLDMIRGYCETYGIEVDADTLRAEAIEWQATRGARSGRVAWQFFTDLAGRRGVKL
jgi:predicted AAA+ superfamily ATPase